MGQNIIPKLDQLIKKQIQHGSTDQKLDAIQMQWQVNIKCIEIKQSLIEILYKTIPTDLKLDQKEVKRLAARFNLDVMLAVS